MSPNNLEAVKGFLVGSSGPLIFAFLVAISDVRRRSLGGRYLLFAVYGALAFLWVSCGLPATNSSTGSAHFWRNGLFWGLFASAVVGGLWILWSAFIRPIPREPPGFDVIETQGKKPK
jgi:hypothetical protein